MMLVTESTVTYDHDVPVPPAVAKRLLAAAKAVEDARAKRDRLIREAHADGASLREIERAVSKKLTHVGIKRIIERQP